MSFNRNKMEFIEFQKAVCKVVKSIPRGQVMTYNEVAISAGFKGAARAVGSLMKKNYDPEIPCHRVVKSDGKVGEYNRGADAKIELLMSEGVNVRNGRVLL